MKHFRTTLFEGSNSLCEKLVTMAAKANGGADIKLSHLYIVGEGNRLEYPSLNSDISIELIGDTLLHVDAKVKGEFKTVCIIEEIEITELKQTVDDLEGVLN